MHTNAAKLIYFSPTRTTRKVLESIAQGIALETIEHIDLTLPEAETLTFAAAHDDLVIIGAPVYGGRIPIEAVHRLQRVEGHDTPAAIVVVYGNREFEDALLELRDLVLKLGFVPIAGGAFVGEHSFSDEVQPIAAGRPDRDDLDQARAFGEAIRRKVENIDAPTQVPPVQVPGDFPYKERGKPFGIAPVIQPGLCDLCGDCAAVCPTGAITVGDVVTTDPEACILCCACVKACPIGARMVKDPRVKQMTAWLYTSCQKRKEPGIYS